MLTGCCLAGDLGDLVVGQFRDRGRQQLHVLLIQARGGISSSVAAEVRNARVLNASGEILIDRFILDDGLLVIDP